MPLRWTTRPCFPSYLLRCRTKRRFYLETCLKSTTSTRGERVSSIWSTPSQTDASINNSSLLSTFSLVLTSFYYWQDISKRAGAVHWLSRIGWKMFSAEGERLMTAARVLLLLKNSYSDLFFFYCFPADDRPADLREVLSQQASLWKSLEAVFRLCLLPGGQTRFHRKKKKNTTGFDLTLFFSKNQECQKKLEHKLGLDSYLLKPVQRITKYQLLLKVQSFF